MTALEQLTEDWAAGIPAARWTSTPGAAVAGGHLELTPTEAYSGVESVALYDLTDSHLAVQLLHPPLRGGGSLECMVRLSAAGDPAGEGLEWQATTDLNDNVALRASQGPPADPLNPNAPDPTVWLGLHDQGGPVWLRIRESLGMVLWETALDGLTWTVRAWAPPTFPVDAVRVSIRAGYYVPEAEYPDNMGTAAFGPVNLTPAPPEDPPTIITGSGMPNLAVDVIPELELGTFLLDVSDADGPDLLGWAAITAGAWRNVVCDVTAVSITRGSSRLQGVLTRAEAGSCTVQLRDTARQFDPMANADAIHQSTPVRVRAWGYDTAGERWDAVLFTGTIRDLPVSYPRDGAPLVTLSAADLIADLSTWGAAGHAGAGVGAGDNLLQRVERTLAEMGRGPEALSLDVDRAGYTATLPGAALARPWVELGDAQDAELGRMWVDAANQLVVRSRRSELSGPVRGTLSDVHGDADPGTPHCCVADGGLLATLGTEQTTNRAVAARRIPSTGVQPAPVAEVVQVDEPTSQARWGWHVTERRSLELESDAQVHDWAEYLVATSSAPELRVDSVTPDPSPVDLDSALQAWPAVCATDLGDRWAVRYHPELGPVVDRMVGVLGVEHAITPDAWRVTFTTVDAPAVTPGNPTGWFELDVSELDSGDVLSPYARPWV